MTFLLYKEQEFYRSIYSKYRCSPAIRFKPEDSDTMREYELNRLVEMAWQDRLPFEIIQQQYNLTENQLKKKMRVLISPNAYRRWRKRVQGRRTKHTKKLYHTPQRFQGPW